MKITAWKTVEVECEVEVELEQIMAEFAQRVDESEKDYWRRMLPAMDCMTRIMARISDETIDSVEVVHRAVIKQRLQEQAERW